MEYSNRLEEDKRIRQEEKSDERIRQEDEDLPNDLGISLVDFMSLYPMI